MSRPIEQLGKGKGGQKTALREVVESGTVVGIAPKGQAQATPTQSKAASGGDAKSPAKPALPATKVTVTQPLQVAHADLAKVDALVRAAVKVEGDGVLQFKPALATVKAAGMFPLVAFATVGKTHGPSVEVPFKLEVLRPKAMISLEPVPALEYHPTKDFAKLLAALASCDSGAPLSFHPALATVRDAKDYDITISAPETPQFTAPDPVHLIVAVAPTDAKFTVGTPGNYVFETPVDLRQHIAAHCEAETPDSFDFQPPLDQVGVKPGPCKVVVSLKDRSNYRPEAPKTVTWNVLRKTQSLKLPKVDDHIFDIKLEKTFFKELPKKFEIRPADLGKLTFDPPLEKLKYAEGEFAIKVWLAENELYQKSEVEVLTFKIFMNAMDCSSAFSKWWQKAEKKQRDKLGGSEAKAKSKFCGDPVARIPPPDNYTTEAQLLAVLDAASAGLKNRAQIWAALGYPTLTNASAWKMDPVPDTTQSAKAHLTISYGNIITPTTLDFWKQSDATIYDALFKGPPNVAMRVHASLEDYPEPGRNLHVFLGNAGYVSGDNKPRQATAFGGQVGEMFTALDNFKAKMVTAIGAKKGELGTAG